MSKRKQSTIEIISLISTSPSSSPPHLSRPPPCPPHHPLEPAVPVAKRPRFQYRPIRTTPPSDLPPVPSCPDTTTVIATDPSPSPSPPSFPSASPGLTPGKLVIKTLLTSPTPLGNRLRTALELPGAPRRQPLVDWLASASFDLNLKPHTYALSVRVLDEALTTGLLIRQNAPIIAMSALFVASKLEEYRRPKCVLLARYLLIHNFEHPCHHPSAKHKDRNTRDESVRLLMAGERWILTALKYDVYRQTAVGVTPWLTDGPDHVHKDAEFIALVGLLDPTVSALPVACVAAAAARIALCINSRAATALDEFLDDSRVINLNVRGEYKAAVVALIAAYLRLRAEERPPTVITMLSQIASHFAAHERELRALVDAVHEEVTPTLQTASPTSVTAFTSLAHPAGDGLIRKESPAANKRKRR